jgi:hypothetical protein
VYKCESTVTDLQQLENMKKQLDTVGCNPVWSKLKIRFRYLTLWDTLIYVQKCWIYYILYQINYSYMYYNKHYMQYHFKCNIVSY